jgi:hypothetical protein
MIFPCHRRCYPLYVLILLLLVVVYPSTYVYSAPSITSTLSTTLGLANVGSIGGAVQGVAVGGGIVYLAEGTGLTIVDARTPAQPRQIARLPLKGRVIAIDVAATKAYLTTTYGLEIVDVRDVRRPKLLANLATQGIGYAIQVVDTLAYVADESQGLLIIDVRNPAHPALRGMYTVDGGTNGFGLQVVDNLAYIAGNTN